jgi:competence protein ComEA
VNINTASAKELQQLPSIGVKRAQAIIAYRTKHHFGSIYELTNIKGIGRKTIAKLRNKVVVQGKTILTKTKKK